MIVEEEDIPIHNRPRIRTWASSQMASLPRPLLGSRDRHVMLEDARRLDKDADVLYEKIIELRKEAELLREQAYQKRVLCAPIRSLPLETLSRILVLATPDSFAFHGTSPDLHPLSEVSRLWSEIIKSTPEFYSRISVVITPSDVNRMEDAARRLPSWLAKARNVGLDVFFYFKDSLHPDQSLYSSGPAPAMWTMLLSLVGNWQTLFYRGPSSFIHQFWGKAKSAKNLEILSLKAINSPRLDSRDVIFSNPFLCSVELPKLHRLMLTAHTVHEVITEQMLNGVCAPSLQSLTLRRFAAFSKDGLPGFAASFPFVTDLSLEEIAAWPLEPSATLLSGFKYLQYLQLSHSVDGSTVPLSALHGCSALKSVRLQFSAFHIGESCKPLTSVERLELELGMLLLVESQKLEMLYATFPSLKFLKAMPQVGYESKTACDARGLLLPLFVQEDVPVCPDLAELILEKVIISRCNIGIFIADRTFDATPATLEFLEQNCIGEFSYKNDEYRSARHQKWKPTCRVTTIDCPKIPDMVDAGVQDLVEACKIGNLTLVDFGVPFPDCESHCDCECEDQECDCCEHKWVDSD